MRLCRIGFLVLAFPLGLGGCLSFSSSSPPRETVIVAPATTTVVCQNGLQPPC